MMKKILLINAHLKYEGYSEGRLTQTIITAIRKQLNEKGHSIKETYIEKNYDVEEEIAKHEWADIIITQAPVNNFSLPWIHKKYIDDVFFTALGQGRLVKNDGRTRKDPNKQYGTGGLMQGKEVMLSLTWNAPKEEFGDKNQSLFAGQSPDDAFSHITNAYRFCGVSSLPSFSFFDVVKNPNIEGDLKSLKEHIDKNL